MHLQMLSRPHKATTFAAAAFAKAPSKQQMDRHALGQESEGAEQPERSLRMGLAVDKLVEEEEVVTRSQHARPVTA